MPQARLHADEVDIGLPLVERLVEGQFPHWAGLPIARVASDGTDNAIFRLGDDMAVRLPRHPGAARQVEKEQRWLPRLASHLPLPVPVPLGQGVAGKGYPYRWSVCRWLEGEDALRAGTVDLQQAAVDLAGFIAALRTIDPSEGPPPGAHNFGRGAPLAERDGRVGAAISSLDGIVDTDAARAAWAKATEAPAWAGPNVWLHGDLLPGNLLVRHGRLSGIIDFGGLGVGDPACDLMVAWTVLDSRSRAVLREILAVDEATWERARGWALSMGLIVLPYYRDSNPVLVGIARRAIDEVLADRG